MRRLGSVVLGAIAALAITMLSVGVWARQQALSTDRFVAAMTKLPADPAIQTSVATQVSAEVERQILERLQAVSPALVPLTKSAIVAARPLIERGARGVMASPAFHKAWDEGVADLHRQAVKSVQRSGTSAANDVLVVNLDSIASVVRDSIATYLPAGLIEQVQVDLPPYELQVGDGLSTARRYVKLGEGLLVVMAVAALVSLGWCVGLARRRLLAVGLVGVGVAVGALVVYGLSYAGSSAVDSASLEPAERSAARAIYAVLGQSLRSRTTAVGLVALAAAAIGIAVSSTQRS